MCADAFLGMINVETQNNSDLLVRIWHFDLKLALILNRKQPYRIWSTHGGTNIKMLIWALLIDIKVMGKLRCILTEKKKHFDYLWISVSFIWFHSRMIGHFTQMAQDRATLIGCALINYRNGRYYTSLFACNYSLTNLSNQPVYVSGPAASGCPAKNNAFPGLCRA